ncbi:Uncharacterised protein [[Clostridium] sordellii]|uniref:Uncharacterized protein n=1 Tax=Paraclostridium sordellii TaxID=1505 RepID=A0A0C7R5P1_PARSO|nr:Uncharacterised protein [[Clostridium] sordellii] [Paeniclostridium sordellii]CEQ03434.1 Uncharacterised protein [[Clostridium] sordellii] [Paeniclostridium sordellii]
MNVYLAEFIVVTMLIFFGCGVLAGNVAINISWGCTVA